MAGAVSRLCLAVLVLLSLLVPAHAYDEAKLKQAERLATLLQAQLKGVAARIDSGTLPDDALASQRISLEKIRTAASVGADNAAGPLNEIAALVSGLGPAPTDGQIEAESIATQRKELGIQLARATAAQKQFLLVGREAEQAMARLTSMQRGQFLQRIFKADKSILNPSLWTNMTDGGQLLGLRISNMVSAGLSESSGRTNYAGLLLLPIGLTIMGFLFLRILPGAVSRFQFTAAADDNIDGLEKLWHVIWRYLNYVIAILLLWILIYATLDVTGLLTRSTEDFSKILTDALRPALFYGGLMYFIASPNNPVWRLVAIDNGAARALVLLVTIGYLIYGFGDQIAEFASSINLPVSFAVGQTALSSLCLIGIIALGLIIVRREASKGMASEGTTYFLTWFMNFMPLWWMLLVVAGLSLMFGFIALSYFIAGNLLDTAILAVSMGLLHAFTDALASAALNSQSGPGRTLRRITHWSEQSIQRLVLILRTLADAVLITFTILALIALWTVVLFDMPSFFTSLSEGFRIGNISLSPRAIAIAAGVLAIGITATRYFTHWLERRVLRETGFDKGVQDSLRAAAGYTGYSLAAAFALTAAGLDFSSLALVAGALGVGIGFGLQSIVNNFVSGLILLAERPVRVGDWVVTNAGEGIVKKINVRSTEIETFDNCTIIVPNSNLISEAVRNWTHRDSVGRFTISVTFHHAANAGEIAATLQSIVQAHPKVMRHPPPTVQLLKITVVGYEFDIRGHIQDVFEAAQTASEIRLEIAKALPQDSLSSTLPPPPPEKPVANKKKSGLTA
jgi:potassium-dependent mechanosensitive channel